VSDGEVSCPTAVMICARRGPAGGCLPSQAHAESAAAASGAPADVAVTVSESASRIGIVGASGVASGYGDSSSLEEFGADMGESCSCS
jgi:hypothetical protein